MYSYILLLSLIMKMQTSQAVRYLPLGDSYTVGTGALEKESWPYLLAEHLKERNINCRLLENPARNGFTTADLIEHELPLVTKLRPDFVTLLVGVNDWVRGVAKSDYHKNLIFILDEVQKQIPDKQKIILVTIPDFGVTPEGKNYGRGRNISEGISEFNMVIKEEAEKRNLVLVDIFEISKRMESDKTLVSKDGLHPSAKEYAFWEKMILPAAIKLLK